MAFGKLNIPITKITPASKYKFFNVIKYVPHEAQRRFHDSPARFRIITAGSRTGKTTAAAAEAMAYAFLPNKVIWCVAPTYDLSEKVFREIWKKMVEDLECETLSGTSYRDRKIRFAWGTDVLGRSCENPKSLLGEGVDFMVVDEAARIAKAAWDEYLRERLMDTMGHALIISSPKGTAGWFPEFYRRGQNTNPDFDQWKSWRMELWENPHIPRQEIENMRIEMTKEVFDQEVLGMFVPYGGLVFKTFSEKMHVSSSAVFKPEVPIVLAIDFGYRNPCSVSFAHRLGEKTFDVFDEYYFAGRDNMDNAIAVREQLMPYLTACKHKTVMAYHDPSGADDASIFKKFIPELVMMPGVNDITPGIDTIRAHIKYNAEKERSNLLINPKCENTIWEFTVYHYPKRLRKHDDATVSELPVDVDNHSMAALRYWLHTVAPVSHTPLDYLSIRSTQSTNLCIREAGDAYIREIADLKNAFRSENKAPEK